MEPKGIFRYLDTTGADFSQIQKKYLYVDNVTAPVEKGTEVGYISYSLGGTELGRTPIVASEAVEFSSTYSLVSAKPYSSRLLASENRILKSGAPIITAIRSMPSFVAVALKQYFAAFVEPCCVGACRKRGRSRTYKL